MTIPYEKIEKIEKFQEKEETIPARSHNLTDHKPSNNIFTNTKIPNEITQNKDYTNSSSSEKNREVKKHPKQNDKRSNPHKSQQKLLPLPANNLLNIDEWQNSDKFPLIKTNQMVINSTINHVKQELLAIATTVPNEPKEAKEAYSACVTNPIPNFFEDPPLTLQTGQTTCTNTSNIISSLKSEPKPIEFEIQNEPEYKAILPTEEKNPTVDDSFYDQKEDLFTNNLPPEVMGGTPEFQKYEEMQTNLDDQYNSNCKVSTEEIFPNNVVNMKSNVDAKYTNCAANANTFTCNNILLI
jgi:hypothetical protein